MYPTIVVKLSWLLSTPNASFKSLAYVENITKATQRARP